MSIIKIPSSNIYAIGNDFQLIGNNNKTKSTVEANDFQANKGNILSPEYVIHFWKTPQQPNEAPFVFWGGSEKYNDVIFEVENKIDSGQHQYIDVKIKEIISRFRTDKTLLLNYNYNNVVKGGYLVKEDEYNVTMEANVLRHEYVDGQTETPSTYFETITYQLTGLRYYPEDNTFWAILSTDKLPNEGDPIRVYEKVNDGVSWYEWWLISATIKVEGTYYVPQKTNKEFGTAESQTFVIKLPSNELVQTESFVGLEDIKISLLDNVLENVVKKYSNGKEVYELKCSISRYNDTNGNVAIEPTNTSYPATFEKHDIVEPYIFTSKGEVPLSTKSDGTPKRFEIIGIDYEYRGVVWQKLTIQEYVE